MSISTITVGGQTLNLVTMPTTPALRSVSFAMTDSIAASTSPFALTSQYYQWAGADLWSGTAALPEMRAQDAAPWIAFLMALRGTLNVFQLGDPLRTAPMGGIAGTPGVDTSVAGNNAAGTATLYTAGWVANTPDVLLPGDHIQLGYRMYVVLDSVTSDSNGKAAIPIWPSLRESPSGNLVWNNCQGLFRLAGNKRQWSADETKLTQISFSFVEAR